MVRQFLVLLALLLPGQTVLSDQVGEEKIVYHLHHVNSGSYHRAISNLENLIKGMPETKREIKLMLQGQSIHLLGPSVNTGLKQRLNELRKQGLIIETSRDNYDKNQLLLDSDSSLVLVDNIFARIIELDQQGYRYITP